MRQSSLSCKVLHLCYDEHGLREGGRPRDSGKTEVFNSNVLKFCPKRVHFPYEGMVVRTKLTAIKTNRNTGRAQVHVKLHILVQSTVHSSMS